MIEQAENLPLGTSLPWMEVLAELRFNGAGLLPAIAQQFATGEVLMLARKNREAIEETLTSGPICYWSRSTKRLWRKGEASGHTQQLRELRVDCDGDTLLLLGDQTGAACHAGRPHSFYNALRGSGGTADGHDRASRSGRRGQPLAQRMPRASMTP